MRSGGGYGLMEDEKDAYLSGSANAAGRGSASAGQPAAGNLVVGGDKKNPPKDAKDLMGGESSFLSKFSAGSSAILQGMPTALGKIMGTKKKEDAPVDPGSYVPPSIPGSGSGAYGKLEEEHDGAGLLQHASTASEAAAPLRAPSPEAGGPAGSSALQLRCYQCQKVMTHSPGAAQVKCPSCSAVNACPTPSPPPSADTFSVSCSGCRKVSVCKQGSSTMVCSFCGTGNAIVRCSSCEATLSCKTTSPVVSCPACTHISQVPQAQNTFVHVTCVGCNCRLQMPSTAPAVSCPRCRTITQAGDPRARPTMAPSSNAPASSSPSAAASDVSAEDEAVQEAIRRSLGQAPRQVAVTSTRTHTTSVSTVPTPQVDDAAKARALTSMCDITGCDAEVATNCLEASGWRLEEAVSTYMEHVQTRSAISGGGGSSSTPTPPPPNHPPPPLAAQDPPPPFQPSASPPEKKDGGLSLGGGTGRWGPTAGGGGGVGASGGAEPQEEVQWTGLEAFMASLGLERYTPILEKQDLRDPEALRHVTDEDLKEMEIATIGARRKLLAGIRRLTESKVVVGGAGAPAAVPPSDLI